jgi:hypothetical protein
VTLDDGRVAITDAGPPRASAKVDELVLRLVTVNWNVPPGLTEAGARLTETPVATTLRATKEFGCSARLNGNAAGDCKTVFRLAKIVLRFVSAASRFAQVAVEIAVTEACNCETKFARNGAFISWTRLLR